MNTKALRVFLEICRTGSFSTAAKNLGISQPAASFQVKALEKEFGVSLLDRSSGRCRPTEAGRALLTHARRILDDEDDLRREMEELRGGPVGPLYLAASNIPGEYILPRLLPAFRAAHPLVRPHLVITDSGGVADLVLEGTVELGWVGMEFKDSRLLCEPFCRDRLVVIAPPHHPACGKRVKPRDLEGETFIWREGGSGTRSHMVRLLSKAGLKPDPEKGLVLGSTTSVIQAVAAGMGLSLVSAWAAETWLKAGKIGRIRWEEETTRWFYTLRLRRRHPGSTASSFLDFLAGRKEELRGILESLST